MKFIFSVVLFFFLIGCNQEKKLDGDLILKKLIIEHDSLNNWSKTKLNIHIQEPRISNPARYSLLRLDKSTNSFELSRNRDQHISKHIIDSLGNSFVFLDGESNIDTLLINKYGLNPSYNIGYKNFYKMLYGFPMALNNSLEKILNTSEGKFAEENCYKLEVELKESVISKYWNIYISQSTMTVKGMEIVIPDKPNEGERIYFEDFIIINGIKFPRIRHWYDRKDNTYLGSDLIIKELSE